MSRTIRQSNSTKKPTTLRKPKRTARPPEQMINDAPRRFDDASLQIGESTRQGDFYFVRLPVKPLKSTPSNRRQLGEGNTQGARHILDRPNFLECDALMVADAIYGATESFRPGRGVRIAPKYIVGVFTGCAVEHPEHGNHIFPSHFILAAVNQRSLDAEEREQRVRD